MKPCSYLGQQLCGAVSCKQTAGPYLSAGPTIDRHAFDYAHLTHGFDLSEVEWLEERHHALILCDSVASLSVAEQWPCAQTPQSCWALIPVFHTFFFPPTSH